jgi:hypothetical protein
MRKRGERYNELRSDPRGFSLDSFVKSINRNCDRTFRSRARSYRIYESRRHPLIEPQSGAKLDYYLLKCFMVAPEHGADRALGRNAFWPKLKFM